MVCVANVGSPFEGDVDGQRGHLGDQLGAWSDQTVGGAEVREQLAGDGVVAGEVEQCALQPQCRDREHGQRDQQRQQRGVAGQQQVVGHQDRESEDADEAQVDDLAGTLRVLGDVRDVQGLAVDVLRDLRGERGALRKFLGQ